MVRIDLIISPTPNLRWLINKAYSPRTNGDTHWARVAKILAVWFFQPEGRKPTANINDKNRPDPNIFLCLLTI